MRERDVDFDEPTFEDVKRLTALGRRFAASQSRRDRDALHREVRAIAERTGWTVYSRGDLRILGGPGSGIDEGTDEVFSTHEVLIVSLWNGNVEWSEAKRERAALIVCAVTLCLAERCEPAPHPEDLGRSEFLRRSRVPLGRLAPLPERHPRERCARGAHRHSAREVEGPRIPRWSPFRVDPLLHSRARARLASR